MSLLPVSLNLSGERAVVIGGGAVALRRTRTLLDAGLAVTVIAPQVCAGLSVLPVLSERRLYRDGDLAGARLVVAATDCPEVNGAVVSEARRLGILINHAGEAAAGNLRFAATAGRAGVQVAVNTGRELPMLAQALTRRIAALLPDEGQIDAWTGAREGALKLDPPQREAALRALRAEIDAALEVQVRAPVLDHAAVIGAGGNA